RRGHTLAGPHRDDLLWTRNGRALAMQASAGGGARAVAPVKLAGGHAGARRAGGAPPFAGRGLDPPPAGGLGGGVLRGPPAEGPRAADDGGSSLAVGGARRRRARSERRIRVAPARVARGESLGDDSKRR